MKKFLGIVAVLVGAGLSATGQNQEVEPEIEVERGAHPAYGAPEREPVKPEPVIATPQLFPADLVADELRATASLQGLTVFEGEKGLGKIEDMVIDVKDARLAYLMVRPDVEFGEVARVDYAVAPQALTVRDGHLYLTTSVKEAATSSVLTEAGLRALVEDEISSHRLPPVVLVEREDVVSARAEYGQPQRGLQENVGEKPESDEAGRNEAVVPPEVRGGVPPEHRGGVPPEVRTPVPSDTGLNPSGATGRER